MAEIGRAGKRVGRHYTLFRGLRLQATLQTKQLQQFRPKMFEQDGPYCESRVREFLNIFESPVQCVTSITGRDLF